MRKYLKTLSSTLFDLQLSKTHFMLIKIQSNPFQLELCLDYL